MWSPAVSMRDCSPTIDSPLSSTWVKPLIRGFGVRSGSERKPGPIWVTPRPFRSSEVDEVAPAGPEPAQLDEVLRVQEQLVHLPHLVDGQPLGPAQQVVEVLEGVLGSVTHVVEAED